nr:hypothetical protein GCM10020063_054920 [Dactylosporangium thailandense]
MSFHGGKRDRVAARPGFKNVVDAAFVREVAHDDVEATDIGEAQREHRPSVFVQERVDHTAEVGRINIEGVRRRLGLASQSRSATINGERPRTVCG